MDNCPSDPNSGQEDLDGDGTVRAEDDEGRQDVLRIAIFFEGERVAYAVRFDPVGTP